MKAFTICLVTTLTFAACAVEPEPEPATSEAYQKATAGTCVAIPPGDRFRGCLGAPPGFPCRLNVPSPSTGSIAGMCQPLRFINFDESGLFPPTFLCACQEGPTTDF